jgi:putative ABC transport system permease protein
MTTARRSRLRPSDLLVTGAEGLTTRPLRSALSGIGIAIGIAVVVAVLAISASSRAQLAAQLGEEANLLTVSAGQSFDGTPSPLPAIAAGMIRRIPPVRAVSTVAAIPAATVRRTAAVPAIDTGGISVEAGDPSLIFTLHARLATGTFLNASTARFPTVVLGWDAARTLGIQAATPGIEVDLAGRQFTVLGILAPVSAAPQIDDAAIVGYPEAERDLGIRGLPTSIYVRIDPDQVAAVAAVLPFTANPAAPESVQTSQPSAILTARSAANTSLTRLLLGLGAVAILVGTIGIANVMIISVIERRTEIGLRRALGATRRHVAGQFVVESTFLSLAGGVGGMILGALVTLVYTRLNHAAPVLPAPALIGGLAAAVLLGAIAGLYPAARAARLAPADALRSV